MDIKNEAQVLNDELRHAILGSSHEQVQERLNHALERRAAAVSRLKSAIVNRLADGIDIMQASVLDNLAGEENSAARLASLQEELRSVADGMVTFGIGAGKWKARVNEYVRLTGERIIIEKARAQHRDNPEYLRLGQAKRRILEGSHVEVAANLDRLLASELQHERELRVLAREAMSRGHDAPAFAAITALPLLSDDIAKAELPKRD